MHPFNFTAQQFNQEMSEYAQKLAVGAEHLSQIKSLKTGVSERQQVYQQDHVVLYQYTPSKIKQYKTPLLIVYALVNRPYMLDIQQNRSLIKRLLAEGQIVYLIDWGYPDILDSDLTLDDHINGYLDTCVNEIRQRQNIDKINIMGVCQGGCLSLCYASLHQSKIQNLITMVTPVDFKTDDNRLSKLVQHVDIDAMVDTLGNIPGDFLSTVFLSLKPFLLKNKKYVDAIDIFDDKEKLINFMTMEKWIFDSPDQAGETFRQFIKDFYQKNKLINGGLLIGDKKINLKKITCPVLNIYAKNDHLVPPTAAQALKGLTHSKKYTELAFNGGHIGIYVSSQAQKLVAPAMLAWLNENKN